MKEIQRNGLANTFLSKINYQARWSEFGEMTSDEKIISKSIAYTFLFYLLGALYLVAPVVGWSLICVLIIRWATATQMVSPQNSQWLIALWIASTITLQIALVVGHISFDLGFMKTIKSTIGLVKGWALLTVFIILGFYLDIRYRIICRAACVVGLAAILITPFLIFSYVAGLPDFLYVSPLKILGGAGSEFFTVILYEIDPSNGSPRWRFFAPWAPAVGLVANIYFMCAWFEKDKMWRFFGLAGNALMIILSASRMGMIVCIIAPIAVWGLSRISRPWLMVCSAIGLCVLALLFEPILNVVTDFIEGIKNARADSTRVREALGNIALYRWGSEAYWFGHGVVESGTHLVEFMPIGSHHNWYGLLFVKGMVGFLAFAIPLAITILVLIVKAQYQVSSRLALGMCAIVFCFSFSENVEILVYMTWPAWLLIGIGLKSCIEDIDSNPNNLLSRFRLASIAQTNDETINTATTANSSIKV